MRCTTVRHNLETEWATSSNSRTPIRSAIEPDLIQRGTRALRKRVSDKERPRQGAAAPARTAPVASADLRHRVSPLPLRRLRSFDLDRIQTWSARIQFVLPGMTNEWINQQLDDPRRRVTDRVPECGR